MSAALIHVQRSNGDCAYLSGFTGELIWLRPSDAKPRDVPLYATAQDMARREPPRQLDLGGAS